MPLWISTRTNWVIHDFIFFSSFFHSHRCISSYSTDLISYSMWQKSLLFWYNVDDNMNGVIEILMKSFKFKKKVRYSSLEFTHIWYIKARQCWKRVCFIPFSIECNSSLCVSSLDSWNEIHTTIPAMTGFIIFSLFSYSFEVFFDAIYFNCTSFSIYFFLYSGLGLLVCAFLIMRGDIHILNESKV